MKTIRNSNNMKSKIELNPKSWIIRTMAIFLSSLSAIDLLKQEYFLGLTFGSAWLMVLVFEKRMQRSEGKKS